MNGKKKGGMHLNAGNGSEKAATKNHLGRVKAAFEKKL
jgi:hypothetical protein